MPSTFKKAISWRTHEHAHTEKTPDWFWAVGLVTIALAIASIIVGNVLFAVVITIGAITLTLQSLKKPRFIEIEIGERGIRMEETLYPYTTLDSFWVEMEEPHDPVVILKSKKLLMPYIVAPIDVDEVDPVEIRDYLLDYLYEEEHHEPLSHKLLERLGF